MSQVCLFSEKANVDEYERKEEVAQSTIKELTMQLEEQNKKVLGFCDKLKLLQKVKEDEMLKLSQHWFHVQTSHQLYQWNEMAMASSGGGDERSSFSSPDVVDSICKNLAVN